jgi:hypothetical protein
MALMYLPYTWDGSMQVSALMYLAGSGAAGAASGCRPGRALAQPGRYAAAGAASALVPGASGAGAGSAGASR